MATGVRRIVVKDSGMNMRFEGTVKAANTIKPGMLCVEDSAGVWTPHATSGGRSSLAIATEDDLQGNSVSTDYAAGSRVFGRHLQRGEEFYGYVAAGQNLAFGAIAQSNGAGAFTAVTTTNIGLVEMREAINLSASGAVATLALMRVL